MAIQDSINQAVGSVAHAAVAGKAIHNQQKAVANQEKQQTLQKAAMTEKVAEEKGNLANLEQELSQGKADLKMAKSGFDPKTGKTIQYQSPEQRKTDLQMRKKSLQILGEKIAAKTEVINAYNQVLGGKR